VCRLYGQISQRDLNLALPFFHAPGPFASLRADNPDGWGVAFYPGDRPVLLKRASSEPDAETSLRALDSTDARLAVAHLRKATLGSVSRENTHPFTDECWSFVHNGGLSRAVHYRALTAGRKALIQGQTASEVYFHTLLQSIQDHGSVPAALENTLPALRVGARALNFLLTDGRGLWAYRECRVRPDHYSLWTSDVQAEDGSWRVRIASQPLEPHGWTAVPQRRLVHVASDGDARIWDCSDRPVRPVRLETD
jgi:glutamine amidotransferase